MESKSKVILISDTLLNEPGMTIQILKERIALEKLENAIKENLYKETLMNINLYSKNIESYDWISSITFIDASKI